MGVLRIRTPVFEAHIKAPDFGNSKEPKERAELGKPCHNKGAAICAV